MRSMWMRPGETAGTTVPALGPAVTNVVRVAGVAVLGGLFVMLWILGVAAWS
jgi:hypothetical protein